MRNSCICCHSALEPFLSLGDMPLANALPGTPSEPEHRYPLDLGFCTGCSLVQLLEAVPRETLFASGYIYHSSYASTMLDHARNSALQLIQDRELTHSSLVIEIGSNDGYMLQVFHEHGITVLGVDPARGPAEVARDRGIPTRIEFFDLTFARLLAGEGRHADVVLANNVLAHSDDPLGLLQGVSQILRKNGVLVVEVPYIRDLIEKSEFDTIYHEHLCYFSVTAVNNLMKAAGLQLTRVEHIDIHGGSLRLFANHLHHTAIDDSVADFLEAESRAGLDQLDYYADFSSSVSRACTDLVALLEDLRNSGASIAAYGAAAKGSVLLNVAGIGADVISFVADRNPHKQNRLMPGVHIPIRDPDHILAEMPDYLVILAWNLADEIMGQQQVYRARGGQFIIPLPHPRVVA